MVLEHAHINASAGKFLYTIFNLFVTNIGCKRGLGTLCSKYKSLCYAPMLHRANHYAPCSDLLCSIRATVGNL